MKNTEKGTVIAEKVLEQWREEKTDMQQIMIIEEHFEEIKDALGELLSGKKNFKDYKKLKEWLVKQFMQEEEHE